MEVTERLGMPLKIAAKVDAADASYFRDEIEPLLADPLIEFIGEIGDNEKSAFLGNASALLFPIDWPEPFGLVLIEAMACGTPVIAWRCGSVSEIVDDGKTGFIVDTEDEAVRAVLKLDQLDRPTVRRVFEDRFTADVMARNYLRLYRRLYGTAGTADVGRRILATAQNALSALSPLIPPTTVIGQHARQVPLPQDNIVDACPASAPVREN